MKYCTFLFTALLSAGALLLASCTPEERAELIEKIKDKEKTETSDDAQVAAPSGFYALDDGTGLSNRYLSFSKGKFYDYQLKKGLDAVVLAEGKLWHCAVSDFESAYAGDYEIADGILTCSGMPYGAVKMEKSALYLDEVKFSSFSGMQADWYTVISLEGGLEQKFTYRKQSVSIPITLEKSVSGSIPSALTKVSWISSLAVKDGLLTFALEENNTKSARNGTVKISCPGADAVTLSLKQTYATSSVSLEKESQEVDYAGGEFSFAVTVKNPREDTKVTAKSSDTWISNIRIEGETLTYTVAENNSVKARTGKITVKYGTYDSVNFTVFQSASPVLSLALNKTALPMTVLGTETLIASVNPADASLTWSSSNPDVASVTQQGKVSALTAGEAKITVSAENGQKTAECVVTVNRITPTFSISENAMEFLVGGNPRSIGITSNSDCEFAVSSSNPSVASASVSEKKVTVTPGVAGVAEITVSCPETPRYASVSSLTCRVTVNKRTPTFSLSENTMDLLTGGNPGFINIVSDSDCEFTASSSDPSVVSVSVSGKMVTVTPGVVGSAEITVGCPQTPRYASVSSLTCRVMVYDVAAAVDLSSSPANCYIVNAAGVYKLKTVKGNSSTSVGSVSSAVVLWESFGTETRPYVGDIIHLVFYQNGEILLKTPSPLKNGNAVIAAKDANGEILWSWHIWVCEGYDPVATAQEYYNNAGKMMDRNLGATSATPGDVGTLDLLYQWGRKDPFLGGSSISSNTTITWPGTVSSNSSNGTIAYAVAHPTTFITYNSSNYDWYYTGSSSTDNTRWQSSKTIYDPCPPGWRVPDGGSNGVWSKATGGSYFSGYPYDKGMNFSGKFGSAGNIWYPASGWLGYDGSLRYVGNNGRWWSCTPSDCGAYSLCLNRSGDVFPSLSNFRAYGFSVRCLQE